MQLSGPDLAPTRADHWFAAYSADHQHPVNQRLHQWCVPAILWSLLALLYAIPLPFSAVGLWPAALADSASYGVVAWVAAVLALGFWVWLLPWRLGFAMTLVIIACLYSSALLLAALGVWGLVVLAASVFVIAWVGQFIGHHVEGKRPSFLTDLVYLMIGPPWVMIKIIGSTASVGSKEPMR